MSDMADNHMQSHKLKRKREDEPGVAVVSVTARPPFDHLFFFVDSSTLSGPDCCRGVTVSTESQRKVLIAHGWVEVSMVNYSSSFPTIDLPSVNASPSAAGESPSDTEQGSAVIAPDPLVKELKDSAALCICRSGRSEGCTATLPTTLPKIGKKKNDPSAAAQIVAWFEVR